MDFLSTTIVLLPLFFGLGTFFWSRFIDVEAVGSGFIRMVGNTSWISTLLSSIGMYFWGDPDKRIVAFFILILTLVIFLLSFFQKDKREYKDLVGWIILYLSSLAVIYLSVGFSVQFLVYFLSTFFIGVINYSMLLGHYYLVVPKLSEKPLVFVINFIFVATIIKFLLYICSGYSVYQSGVADLFDQMLILMRGLWGFGAVGVLAFFAWRLAKMRSIQSCTGVLYVMVFFMLIGEILGIYYFLRLGLIS